jgi:hypothetical protein
LRTRESQSESPSSTTLPSSIQPAAVPSLTSGLVIVSADSFAEVFTCNAAKMEWIEDAFAAARDIIECVVVS